MNRAPGTPEILNWITVVAAMDPIGMTLVDLRSLLPLAGRHRPRRHLRLLEMTALRGFAQDLVLGGAEPDASDPDLLDQIQRHLSVT